MSTPPVQAGGDDTLASVARRMAEANIGSVIIAEGADVVGIVTERDLLRAAAVDRDPATEPARRWMTARPDVLGPEEEADVAWSSLSHHHYRHLPVVSDGALVGVVSLRDLMGIARLRPADEPSGDIPGGLEGVVVAETTVGDVRGLEGFFHYRQYSAVELAATRSLEDVWYLMAEGELPDGPRSDAFTRRTAALRSMPPGLTALLPDLAGLGQPLDVLRTAVSVLGGELGWPPTHDGDPGELAHQALRLCAVVPTILTATYRLGRGLDIVLPRSDLGYAANYLWMLTGVEPTPAQARALEQYLILTIDHGFNSSTFTARVITSTGADLAAAICGAIGALSGPLHGGAPSRALDMLDAIGTPDRARAWIDAELDSGRRIMGMGHRIYRVRDPRAAVFEREIERLARADASQRLALARAVERAAEDALASRHPDRPLRANVEFFTAVLLEAVGLPREAFSPTFAVGRV
ncbi:MAG TPA: citrate/2-methylcitrate synthase, partial [Acidimicrobiales bacterium]|nr:citrate/2-methylcitrate synthase [Acidimicrobiales bacterium]